MSKYNKMIDLCDKMMSYDPNERPDCSEIKEQINLWSFNKILLSQQLYFKLSKKSSFFDSFIYSMMSLNQIYVLCDCGLEIQSINLIGHQNNCVHSLKRQLEISSNFENSLRKEFKDMSLKVSKLELENDFKFLNKLQLIQTNMPQLMRDRLTGILTDIMGKNITHINQINEMLREQLGSSFNILIGNQLFSKSLQENNYIHFKLFNYDIVLFMDINPANFAFILEKLIETLSNSIESKVFNEDLINTWNLFSTHKFWILNLLL